MFSKTKEFLLKNLIALSLLVVIAAAFGASQFLESANKKEASNQENSVVSEQKPEAKQEKKQSDDSVQTSGKTETQTPSTQKQENKSTSQTQVQGATTQTPLANPQPTTENPITKTVTLNIDTGTNFTYKVSWTDGLSVWDVLDKASKESSFDVVARWNNVLKSYYVTGIHGKVCECWTYKLNGTTPALGSSLVKVNENDIITWKAS